MKLLTYNEKMIRYKYLDEKKAAILYKNLLTIESGNDILWIVETDA